MASTETRKKIKYGQTESDDQRTYRQLTEKRTCQKVFGRKYCTPYVDTELKIHFSAKLADKVITRGAGAGGAVAVGIAASGAAATGGISAVVSLLAFMTLHLYKNEDGSLDLYFDNASFRIDNKIFPTTQAAYIMRVLAP